MIFSDLEAIFQAKFTHSQGILKEYDLLPEEKLSRYNPKYHFTSKR